jgi:hypothetical protein
MTIEDRQKHIPFGNSAFQIANFILNQESPERAYRAALLNYDAKMKALKESQFRRRRKEIDIREIEMKLKTAEGFAQERLLIDLEEAEYGLDTEIKVIEDALVELELYKKVIESLPEYTREDFEKSERLYWAKRLLKQANLEIKSTGTVTCGVLESLDKIGVSVGRNDKGQLIVPDEILKLIGVTNGEEDRTQA